MMSELAHQDTDIETQKATRNNTNNVVPLQRKPEDVNNFAELGELSATSMFMSSLRHESRAAIKGDGLAKIIESYLGQRGLAGEQSLESRLSQIVSDANPDDKTYDLRYENDPIFAYITSKLVTRGNNQNTAEQRSAARKLLDLRVSLPDFVTTDDETWLDITGRLMD